MSIIAGSRLRAGERNPMFDNAVAYYRFDETTGDAIDLVNGYNGTLNGLISRNGEYYTFDKENEYVDIAHVEIADEDDFSFTDGSGNNTDFVIKTEVIFDTSKNYRLIVSKRENSTQGVKEWQFTFINDVLTFAIWNSSNVLFKIDADFGEDLGQKHIIGVTLNGNTISLFVDGIIIKEETLPSGFTFYNGTSKLQLGDSTSLFNVDLKGKLKETVIVKGNGWTQQNITDNYNGGAGITY
jgi:hypothetical protein